MNARKELQEMLIRCRGKILYADIRLIDDSDVAQKRSVLYSNHGERNLQEFWDSLDYEYDEGFGCQNVYGYVVLDNGGWLERREYDGSEWWSYVIKPEEPQPQEETCSDKRIT